MSTRVYISQLRRASLRRQYALLVEIRDRLRREPEDIYAGWAKAMADLTGDILEGLAEMEGGRPGAHPSGKAWWQQGAGPMVRAYLHTVAWQPVEDADHLKACPECGEIALEGETECSQCGLHPNDDSTWRRQRSALER